MEHKIDARVSHSLILFSFAMFLQATIALSIVGALGPISAEWHVGTTEGALLVAAFGATFAISAPVLQMLVGHWVRRTQILAGISIMTAGAVGFALAPNYPVLFSARVMMGLGAALVHAGDAKPDGGHRGKIQAGPLSESGSLTRSAATA